MAEYKYIILFEQDEQGGFVVTAPSLPGLVSYGETLEAAREMAKDAIKCHLESLKKRSQPIPVEKYTVSSFAEELAIAV